MKISNCYGLLFAAALFLFSACEKDEDPVIQNEEELITTFTLTMNPENGGSPVILSFKDTDGDGGNAPVLTGGTLQTGTVYSCKAAFLNESTQPVTDITSEIMEEDDEHQIFYTPSAGLALSTTYEDNDSNGNPLGISTKITTGQASDGNLTIKLVHEPDKTAAGVKSGDPSMAGGSTDIEVSFPISIL